MAGPYTLDTDDPGNTDIISQFPANERSDRQATEDALNDIEDTYGAADTPLAGCIDYFGSSEPGSGAVWKFPNGQAISRTTFSDLFALIGTTFGVGDGSTTFNLPDLRGRVGVGTDDMGGVSAAGRITSAISGLTGTTLGSAGGDESAQDHKHIYSGPSSGGGGASSGSSVFANTTTGLASAAGDANAAKMGGDSGNVQPSLIVNKLMKVA